MAAPAQAVPVHLLYAVATLGAMLLLSFPGLAGLILVLVVAVVGLALRLIMTWSNGGRDLGRFAPLIAIGLLLVPSFLAFVSVPLSLRGAEGAGSAFGGFPSIGSIVPYSFAFALFLLPICMVGSLWGSLDRPRHVVLAAGVLLWILGVGAAAWAYGAPTGLSSAPGREIAVVTTRLGLLVLAFGFLYGLKSDPRIGNPETLRDIPAP